MLEQLEIEEFIAKSARRTDPETSRLAAERVAKFASKGRMDVLGVLLNRPLTDFEIAAAIGRQQTSAGKRRGELRDAGLVEAALDGRGERATRAAPSGSPAIIWQITPLGREFYRQHGGQA